MRLFAGVMTGTSLDSIDLSLLAIGLTSIKRLDFAQRPFPKTLKDLFLRLHKPDTPSAVIESARAGVSLAREIASLVQAQRSRWQVYEKQYGAIQALGVHGQTITHLPEDGLTVQINAPAWIAEFTGLDVVSDFRSRDLSVGGQGAPLVPPFHAVITRDDPSPSVAVLNLGGIANLTTIQQNPRRQTQPDIDGFDVGPANMLLDLWAETVLGRAYDEDGRLAAQGTVDPRFVAQLREDPFFSKTGPKSTGRDTFNAQWLDTMRQVYELKHGPLSPADVQASLVRLTAESVAQALPDGVQSLYICGGGAKNPVLMADIAHTCRKRLPGLKIGATDLLGWPTQEVEAAAFAWLAYCCVNRIPANLPSVTGARAARVLGSITPAGLR